MYMSLECSGGRKAFGDHVRENRLPPFRAAERQPNVTLSAQKLGPHVQVCTL